MAVETHESIDWRLRQNSEGTQSAFDFDSLKIWISGQRVLFDETFLKH